MNLWMSIPLLFSVKNYNTILNGNQLHILAVSLYEQKVIWLP